jgi:hypothetical protein
VYRNVSGCARSDNSARGAAGALHLSTAIFTGMQSPSGSVPPRARSTSPRASVVRRLLLAISLPWLAVGCDSNPFDATQVPRVTATPNAALPVVFFTFLPDSVQQIRVYRGATAGDGYTDALMWSLVANTKNSIRSGVEYGRAAPAGATTDVPARPLLAGQTYTVQVARADPKGTGDGFTNTSNRYVGVVTFAIPSTVVNSSVRTDP